MTIGTRIRQARLNKGYSQQEVADRLTISQNKYHKIENNEVKVKAEDLLRIAQELDTDVNELLKDERNIFNIKYNNHSQSNNQSINGTVVQSEVSLEEVRQLYEQVIQGKDEVLRSKEELIRTKDGQLALLEARIMELLAEIKRLRGE
jgi:transcriptional regulator with XRE-family HTH domain